MRSYIADDSEAISARQRELFNNSNAVKSSNIMPRQLQFKEPRVPLLDIRDKMPRIILVFEGRRFGHDGVGWFELT